MTTTTLSRRVRNASALPQKPTLPPPDVLRLALHALTAAELIEWLRTYRPTRQ